MCKDTQQLSWPETRGMGPGKPRFEFFHLSVFWSPISALLLKLDAGNLGCWREGREGVHGTG